MAGLGHVQIEFKESDRQLIIRLCDLLEANRAKPESSAADCSAGGPAAPMPSDPSVQPGGLEPLQAYIRLNRKVRYLMECMCHDKLSETDVRVICSELDIQYEWLLHIRSEVG